ncbi:MAG: Ti-type conjugative transfer relaxase TraA [Frankiales bacterium]|nr:Ti-type conjugative transfer relaxase TraA [Frankiales bacterium]
MLSIGKLGAGQASYYLDAVADGAEDYYVHGGEAPGQWIGAGAPGLGLTGQVDGEAFTALLRGQHPAVPGLLGRPTKVPGFDLTFSAPKSASLLFGLGEPDLAEKVKEAHDAAVQDALGYLERVASDARRGHAGAERISTGGFVAAAFRHRTSRAGDPHLHTHVVVANRVLGEDGRWTALDARALYVQAKTAGTLYGASLRAHLQDLGLSWTVAPNGLGELEDIPREVLRTFSTRRQQIESALDDRGLSSARAAQAATLDTRQRKEATVDPDSLRSRWQARATEAGFGPASVEDLLETGRQRSGTKAAPDLSPLLGPAGLTATSSTFSERDLLRAVAVSLPDGGTVTDVERQANELLQDGRVLPLTERERALRGEPVLRRRRGGLVPVGRSELRWSTLDLLALEQRVVEQAKAGRGRAEGGPESAVAEALAARPHLNQEQADMVRSLVLSQDLVQLVSAAAGSGKTTAMGAAVQAWQDSGHHVVGVTLAARAAKVLAEETGLPAFTFARAQLDLRDPRSPGLPPGTVVVVDEAGQVGTRALAELLQHVDSAGGKLVLVGDPHQLPEIEAGGAYRGLLNRLPVVELEANHRQVEPEEKVRLAELRTGNVTRAMAGYDAAGRVVRADDGRDARQRLVGDWLQSYGNEGAEDGSVVMIGLTNADVDKLNELARAALRGQGRLPAHEVEHAGRLFAIGDKVVTRRNDSRLKVLNGDRWTVRAVGDFGLLVEPASGGRPVVLPRLYEDVQHAYAITTSISQGSTVERAFVLASDSTYREAGYTAASRARQETRFYVVEGQHEECGHGEQHGEATDPLGAFVSALQRSGAEPMALDSAAGRSDPARARGRESDEDERDQLRERLAEGPADLGRRLASARRELVEAETVLSRLSEVGVTAKVSQSKEAVRLATWAERRALLEHEVADLEEHQALRGEWLKAAATLVERYEVLEPEAGRGAPEDGHLEWEIG